jgi:pyrroline-5-carboxylate reductase
MSNMVCIGSGNMGFALMRGASHNTAVFFTDAVIEKARNAADSLGAKMLNTNLEAAQKGDFIFLAIKPQDMPKVLSEISSIAKDRLRDGFPPVLVSVSAGWSMEKIQNTIGARLPVIRLMPNTPALIGKGVIAMAVSPEVSAEKAAELESFLGSTGIVDVIDESYINAVTGLSGSGPAYVFIFIEALADGGVRAGLPRDKALRYAVQTVLGAASLAQETGKHPDELKDIVASPGGTTIAGIAALEKGAFRGSIISAVEAAWKRAIELG